MSELRPFALVRTADQWLRCSFEGTYLGLDDGVVELASGTTTIGSTTPSPTHGGGLAFDNECRLYHSVIDGGRVERILWKATDATRPVAEQPAPVNLFEGAASGQLGDFATTERPSPLREPAGVAVDVDDRLFVAEAGRDRILVYDLWSERLLRQVGFAAGARPADVAARGNDAYAVLAGAGRVVHLTARSGPWPVELPAGCGAPSRIAISPGGQVAILERAGTPDAHVWFLATDYGDLAAPQATDVEWESDVTLVIAQNPGADFLRYEVAKRELAERPSLRARGYDGRGIVATPELVDPASPSSPRRIGYWTARGFRTAVPARLLYERVGRVTTHRLDSGGYQTTWGRMFLDACIPDGADVRVHYVVLDEPGDDPPLFRMPPGNVRRTIIKRPDLSLPMPPAVLANGVAANQRIHRRESGRELPWTQPAPDDHFVTYEAPIDITPGRFLWVTLELRGNTRVSPKVRCLRAEHPAHDYLRRLPRTFSREPRAASFLLRYLAMFEGFLGETEARGVDRDLLLDPRSTPDECVPWLSSFVGLVLDDRWAAAPGRRGQPPRDARRELIRQAVWLFRHRGTLRGLGRFIEIFAGVAPVIIEHYRMRGIGAAVLGDDGPAFTSSVVGVGFRIGGALGSETAKPLAGSVEDAFRTHAHRFTVIVPAALTDEQLSVVRNIIEVHRPAHTLFDVCTVDAGMRVGRGLMLAISSVIGPTGTFSTAQIGSAVLGRGAIIGRPATGAVLGASRLGDGLRVG